MKVRSRLILVFLLLSVLPLTVITVLSYTSSVRAFRRAVEAEAGEVAMEMGRRLDLVTGDLDRRFQQLDVTGPGAEGALADASPTAADLPERIAPTLGAAAIFLKHLEFVPSTAPAGQTPGASPPPPPVGPRPPAPPASQTQVEQAVPAPPAPPAAPDRIVIDVRGLLEKAQEVSGLQIELNRNDPDLAELLPVIESSIAASLELGAAGAALGLEAAAAKVAEVQRQRETHQRQREALEGKLDYAIRRGEQVLGRFEATLDRGRVFGAVLAMSRRDQGEMAFAVDQQGALYADDDAHRDTLEALDVLGAKESGVRSVGDYMVVTRRDPSGVTFGIARPVGDALRDIRLAAGRNLGLGLGLIGLALVGIVPLSSRMTRDLTALTGGVREIARGHYGTRVNVRSADEFGELAAAFNQMAQDVEAHQQLVGERERLKRELELCRQIQADMLPHGPLRLGLSEVAGVSIPAREVGGDFFNYFLLGDGQVALLVGDVSGKGVSAALLMANIQATLRARLPLERDLAQLAAAIDQEVENNTPGSVFVTLFVGILDQTTNVLRYVNAGHNPQFVLRTDAGLERLASTGLPLGMFAGHGYAERSLRLEPGDLLFFYTDGTVETEDEAGELFGAERLEALLKVEHARRIDELLTRVEQAVQQHRGSAEPFDDATIMALRVGNPSAPDVVAPAAAAAIRS